MALSPSSRSTTVAERVAEDLRQAIRRRELTAGTPLRQNEVAQSLGVSSTPVREAFAILQREGLVQRTVHRGVIVFAPTVRDLLAAYEIRGALEPLAGRYAADRITDTALTGLRGVLEEMARSTADSDRYLELNADFHESIELAADMPRLAELIADQRAATSAYVRFLGAEPESYGHIQDEHRAIVEALESRNPDHVAQALLDHLQARADRLRERFPDAPPVPTAPTPVDPAVEER